MEFDLHVHSKYSFDSVSNPQKIIEVARKKKLNGIAITDHNTIEGAKAAQKIAKTMKDFFVIPGVEINTKDGEILGLFLEHNIKADSIIEAIREIKKQGGIAVLPHPFKRVKKIKEEILENIDAIEGFNARGENKKPYSNNGRALKLAKEKKIPITAGSDAHFYFEIGRGRTIIEGEIHSVGEIKRAILEGKTKIKGKNSSLWFEIISQIIKMCKEKTFSGFQNIFLQSILILISPLKRFFK